MKNLDYLAELGCRQIINRGEYGRARVLLENYFRMGYDISRLSEYLNHKLVFEVKPGKR